MQLFTLLLTLALYFDNGTEPWGVDTDLKDPRAEVAEVCVPRTHLGQKTCNLLIRFFQDYISPIDGPRSSFYPTSSQYAADAIRKHGVLKGIAMGCDRLMRENKELWVYPTTTQYGPLRKLDPVR